jgi:phage-related protein
VIHPTAISAMVGQMADAGERSGNSFGGVFSKRTKAIIGAVAALVVGSLPLLQPLVSIFQSLVAAAGALGAALPLALVAGTFAAATAITVFHNLHKAIKGAFSGTPTKDEKEAYDKLSDSAKKFVGILLDTRTKLKGFQKEIQEQFFKPFVGGFRDLVKSPAIGILRQQMGLLAGAAGRAGADIARVFAASAQSGQLTAILSGVRGIFGQLAVTLGPLTKMFLTLTVAAQPFVEKLTTLLVVNLFKLTNLVDKAAADGRLAKFFDDGLTALLALMRLVVNLGSILNTVFDALSGGSDSALGSLSALTGQLATFLKTAQGQEILSQLTANFRLIGDVIKTVLVPLLPLALQVSQAISGPLHEGIAQVLPALGNFINALVSGLSPILKIIAPLFDQLITVIGNFVVLALREMTSHVEQLMPVLLQFAQEIGPHLGPLIKAFGDLLLALLPMIPTFTNLLISLLPILAALTPLIIQTITSTTWLITVFAQVITWVVQVISWMGMLNQAIGKLPLAVKIVADFLVMVWDHIVSWFTGTIVPSFMKALSDIGGFFAAMGRDVALVWQIMVATIRGFWNDLRGIFDALAAVITQTIPNAFQRGADFVSAQWVRLKAITREPVDFFLNVVVNKGIIGTFNAVAKLIPGIGGIDEVHPAGFAEGGPIQGPGGPRDDVIPAWLSNGEYVIPARTVRERGVDFFNRLIGRSSSPRPGDGSGGIAFADGGLVGLLTDATGWIKDRINLDAIPGGGIMKQVLVGAGGKLVTGLIDWAKEKVSSLFGGDTVTWLGPITGDAAGILAWLRAQNGKPYGWAQAGPNSYDCSGIVSSVWNLMHGVNPYRHTFSTSGQSLFFPKRNQTGMLTAGWANPGERGGGSVGHTAANFLGVGLESTGSRGVHIGAGTTPVTNFAHWGTFRDGGLVARVMDQGGILGPRQIAANTSGNRELMLPEGMKISLSDDTINHLAERIARGIARELVGASMAALHVGRARSSAARG